MNAALAAVPDDIKDLSGIPLIKDINSSIQNNELVFQINTSKLNLPVLSIMSPELEAIQRPVMMAPNHNGYANIQINLNDVSIYAVAQ